MGIDMKNLSVMFFKIHSWLRYHCNMAKCFGFSKPELTSRQFMVSVMYRGSFIHTTFTLLPSLACLSSLISCKAKKNNQKKQQPDLFLSALLSAVHSCVKLVKLTFVILKTHMCVKPSNTKIQFDTMYQRVGAHAMAVLAYVDGLSRLVSLVCSQAPISF